MRMVSRWSQSCSASSEYHSPGYQMRFVDEHCTLIFFLINRLEPNVRYFYQGWDRRIPWPKPGMHWGNTYYFWDHQSQPLLNSLHWLPLKQRIFKLLLFVCKILYNQAPKFLDTCLNLYTPTRSLRSAVDPLRLTYYVTRTLAGDRTFTVSASKYWNDLPLNVRQFSSVSAFRKALENIFLELCNCNFYLYYMIVFLII